MGYCYDKFGFKSIFLGLMITNLLCSISCYAALANIWLYFICI